MDMYAFGAGASCKNLVSFSNKIHQNHVIHHHVHSSFQWHEALLGLISFIHTCHQSITSQLHVTESDEYIGATVVALAKCDEHRRLISFSDLFDTIFGRNVERLFSRWQCTVKSVHSLHLPRTLSAYSTHDSSPCLVIDRLTTRALMNLWQSKIRKYAMLIVVLQIQTNTKPKSSTARISEIIDHNIGLSAGLLVESFLPSMTDDYTSRSLAVSFHSWHRRYSNV